MNDWSNLDDTRRLKLDCIAVNDTWAIENYKVGRVKRFELPFADISSHVKSRSCQVRSGQVDLLSFILLTLPPRSLLQDRNIFYVFFKLLLAAELSVASVTSP